MKDRLYIKIAAMLLGITVLSLAVTTFTARPASRSQDLHIVTSFYPVYIAALNVAGDIDGVEVINMVENTAGCLHDYQMDPSARTTLETADVFVMNGAGAEPFLDAALAQLPALNVIDLSAGHDLLESGHVHTHAHDHEEHAEEAVNSHLWVSPPRYRQQVIALRDGLIAADPANTAAYTANAAAYLKQIDTVWARMQAAVQPFDGVSSLLFHDSLAYLAEDLDLTVVSALNVGEDSGVSAADLSAAEDALVHRDRALFWYDDQYESVQYTYLQQIPTAAVPLEIDTCVVGDGNPTHWVKAMNELCEALEAAA